MVAHSFASLTRLVFLVLVFVSAVNGSPELDALEQARPPQPKPEQLKPSNWKPRLNAQGIPSIEDVNALPIATPKQCTNPKVRKEWRRMTNPEKKSWIDAVDCLHWKKPFYVSKFKGIMTRYDDFVAFHINATQMMPGVHNNGYFLPFHRYLMIYWEYFLEQECGYQGPTPWWDWSLDSPEMGGHFNSSPIFDADLGFGGDGKQVKNVTKQLRCITNGPWARYHARMTWKDQQKGHERCIERAFNLRLAEYSASPSNTLNYILALDKYEDFSELDVGVDGYREYQGGPHSIGHMAVGGEMANLYTSTFDPLFWVHHGGIDHFWTQWQGRNKTRLADVRRTIIEFSKIGRPVPSDRQDGITTLDSQIFHTEGFAPIIKISQVMDTLNEDGKGILCYKYDDAK